MFDRPDIRKSKVWQEAHETGIEKGRGEGKEVALRDIVQKNLANGLSAKEIAKLIGVTVAEVRRLAKMTSA